MVFSINGFDLGWCCMVLLLLLLLRWCSLLYLGSDLQGRE
jgi:hypothetical protein